MKRLQTFFAVLLSLLYSSALMLALFRLALCTTPGHWLLYLGFPLGMLLWFLLAGAILKGKRILSRPALWLWMNLAGYPLAWGALFLWMPHLLMEGAWLVFFFLPVTGILFLAWGVTGLGFLLLRLFRSPPSLRQMASLAQRLLALLTAVAAAGTFICGVRYLQIRPAGAYTDEGVYTFVPTQGYPTNVKVPGSRGTRNVYKITYRTTTQSPYAHTVEAPSRSAGEATVRAREPVQWRVLAITGAGTFLTVPPEDTAGSYTARERRKCLIPFAISSAWLTGAAVVFLLRRRREEERAAEYQP